MTEEKRAGGEDKAWVDPTRDGPSNPYDGDDEFGQQGNVEREEAMGRQFPSGASLKEAAEQSGGTPPTKVTDD